MPIITRTQVNPARRIGRGFLLGALCAFLTWMVAALGFLQSIERSTIDATFRVRGTVIPSPDIVVIEADDSTITRFPFPLPRHVYADLINDLTRAGAKTIGFDVLFPTESGSKADDEALFQATRRSGRVVHAAVFNLDARHDPSVAVSLHGNADTILPRFRIPDRGTQFAETVWGSAALPALQAGSAGLGHVNAPPEYDGVLCRIPHLLRFYGGKNSGLYPSLALACAAHFLGVDPQKITTGGGKIHLPCRDGERVIPVDDFGKTWVNWIGPHQSFPTYSFTSVLDGAVPAEMFKGKVVLIGITAAGSFERHATPFTSVQPAVELQANALDDILMRRPLSAAPDWLWLLMLLALPAGVGALTVPTTARVSGLTTLGILLGLLAAAMVSLIHFHLVLPIATASVASVISWAVGLSYRQFLDSADLTRAQERYAVAVRGANDGLWDWDVLSGEVFYAPRWKSILGYKEDEIGDNIDEWYLRVHPEDVVRLKAQVEAHLAGGSSHFESEHRMRHKDGRWVWVLNRGLRVRGSDGKAKRMAGSLSDISVQVEGRQQLERHALSDVLTGLPNRALFMEVLGRAMLRARGRNQYHFAVLVFDLDRFKVVNDSLGHASGDELLINVARRLESCLRPGDIAARLGGDEFTVLLDDVREPAAATAVADRILQAIGTTFVIQEQEVFPSASVGIAISSPHYTVAEEMLRDADTAMFRAKSLGRARHAIFDEEMHARVLAQFHLEADLRRALERDELLAYYQPIVDLRSGRVDGFEALVRWEHPERGLVSPAEFIPLAEETGLIAPIDMLVLFKACRQMKQWQTRFPERNLSLSVNLSSQQFARLDLVEQVQSALEKSGLAASALKLEITESALMTNPEAATVVLNELRNLGVSLSLDDFGTGYSSLSYLQRLPVDTLKVDQSFVRGLGAAGENSAIVRTIVALAHNLDMGVIAEGIESRVQLDQLLSMECAHGQGYYFAKPLPPTEAAALLQANAQFA